MPIEMQYGTPLMYAQAAQMVGEAQAARQKQAIELEKQRQTADIQMMQYKEQLGLQAEQRAQEWELQKMELRSQSDFALEERKRQILAERSLQKEIKLQDEVEAGIKIIQESKHLSDAKQPDGVSEREKAIYAYTMKKQLGYTVPREIAEKSIKPIFTEAKKQTVLGALVTKSPVSPMGIPLPVLERKEDREAYITNELGPSWRQLLPEAIPLVEGTVATAVPAKPANMPADAFYENGSWKRFINGMKVKWVE